MRLNQIRDYIAVVQNGSLRAAARTLGVSQPAVTKSIRQLEQELQVQLLQRNARGAVVTAAGKAFLARARAVQSELRRAQDDLQVFRGGAAGAVAFGIAPQPCMLLVPDAFEQFRRLHAGARVRVVEGVPSGLLPLVRDGTLDFVVGMRSAGELDGALRFKPLFRPALVVAGRRGHPLRAAVSLKELADATWLMYYPVGSGAMLERAFAEAGVPMPRGIVQCESLATALALLAHTDTLGLLMPQMVTASFGPGPIEQIRVREKIPAPVVGLYLRGDAPMTSAAGAMAQAITAAARRLTRSA